MNIFKFLFLSNYLQITEKYCASFPELLLTPHIMLADEEFEYTERVHRIDTDCGKAKIAKKEVKSL